MATNDFGFGSALAGFESAYSNKASRDYTKQQTKVLADENKRKDIQNVSNTVLGQDAFGVKDGALVADVPKVMNLSDGAFENWFNAGNNARNYYDQETGETVQGYLLKPKAFKDPETGAIRYSLQIRDKNGDIKPVTTSRSTAPDERPAFVDANFLATIFEGQLANTLTQGGLSGYALGKLQGLNLGDSEAGRIQLQLGEDLNKGTSEEISSAVLGVNDIFAETRTAKDVSSADDVSTIKGGQAGPGPTQMSGGITVDNIGNLGITTNIDISDRPIINKIIEVESSGDPNVVSGHGAKGYMQLKDSTADNPGLGVTPAVRNADGSISPEENVRVGTDYFDALTEKYNGDLVTAAMAYNAGMGTIDEWVEGGRKYEDLSKETQDYVAKIFGEDVREQVKNGTYGQGDSTPAAYPSKEKIETLLKTDVVTSRGSGKTGFTRSKEASDAMKGYIKNPEYKHPFNIKDEDWNSLTPEKRKKLTSREQTAANVTVSNEVLPFMRQIYDRLNKIETTPMTPGEEADLRKLAEELGVDGKGRFKVNPKKIKAIKETLSSNPEEFNKMKQNPEEYFLGGQIGGVKGVTTVPTDIPEDMEGIRTWFADENNVAALQKISQKDAENIKRLLEEKQIASKADLIKRYEQGKLDDLEYKQIALIIAHSLDGGTNPNASMNLYQQFINDKQTGNPGVTADDVRKTNISARDLAHRINKFHTEQANTFTTELKELYDAAVVRGFTADSKKLDFSTDNAVFISKLKQTRPSFLKVIRSGGAGLDPAVYREQLELMDGVIAKSIDDKIGDSSEGLVDWIGDLFLRGKRRETLGGDFANFQIEYDQTKKQPNGNPLPIRIQFTNTRGKYQLPADESMSWEDFTAEVGDPEIANYIEARVRGS